MKIAMQISHNCRIEFSTNLIFFGINFRSVVFFNLKWKIVVKMDDYAVPRAPKNRYVSQPGPKGRLFYSSTLRAPADPICTLRISTFLALSLRAPPAPCECSHPGWGPTPQNPTPRDPPRDPQGGKGPFGPLGPLRGPGGPLIRNVSYSEWDKYNEKTFVRILPKYRERM